ncbi:Fis family transcriptional regulator [Actinoplanes utahensis]|uniref:Sensor-like histidine kinase SenX3 n=1 Tax=Actinoplanes utahensis TaxID=1869 RepID=A0A0A6UD85_ACTUT|nr:Fis family transcriptional regulator [Actinoplanes utahensis]
MLLAGVVATVLSAVTLRAAQSETANRVMDQRHQIALAAIRMETGRYRGMLDTLAAGIAADDELTWDEFDVATAPLADAALIGAAPVAFVAAVPDPDVAAAQQRWRDRGATGLTLRPQEGLDEHFFTIFSRTLDESEQQSPSGLDIAGVEPLGTTLRAARDIRQTTVSDAYVLLRDRDKPAAEQQQSFVFAVPVWTRANTPEFRGWVVSGLRGGTFLRDILTHVGQSQISGDLISVNSDGTRHPVASWAGPGDPGLRRADPLRVADREWILETRGDSRHLAGAGWYLPAVTLAGGLTLTALLAWLVHVLATGRARARIRVQEATAELREAEAASRRQADLLGAIMTTISDGVSVVDSRGRLLMENPAAQQLLGLTGGIDDPADWQQHYGVYRPDGRTPLPTEEMPLIRALRGEPTDGFEVIIRNPGHPDGVLLSIDGRPLDPSAGEHGAVAVCRDITELRRYETDLSIFAGVVAHDLKAPLSLVRGHAELACEDLPDLPETAEARDGLRRIVQAVDRMDTLIETMLGYTTARHAPLRTTAVDPAALAREIISDRITGLGPDRPVPSWSVEPLPEVQADPAMLRHVLDNLIGNAIKYVRPGAAPYVEVAAGPAEPGRVRIEVADSGIGIPDADKPYVFESFHRTAAATANYAGTGLGLAICRRIVQRHGGEIGVEDNPGGGTRFWFTLPTPTHTEEPVSAKPADDEAVREALERALAERAAIMDAARLPGLGAQPDETPDRPRVPERPNSPR